MRTSLIRCCSSGAIQSFLNSPPELYRLTPKFAPSDSLSEPTCDRLNEIIDLSEKVHDLRLKKMELVSLPAHSVTGRNRELLSLALGAVSGALSLSFHPGFALIFVVSYRMYRNASQPTRDRLRSAGTIKDVNREILDSKNRIDYLINSFRNNS
jgi:hypothetical protein